MRHIFRADIGRGRIRGCLDGSQAGLAAEFRATQVDGCCGWLWLGCVAIVGSGVLGLAWGRGVGMGRGVDIGASDRWARKLRDRGDALVVGGGGSVLGVWF